MSGERQIRRQEAGKMRMRRAVKSRGDVQEMGGGDHQGAGENEFGVVLSNAKMEAGNDIAQTMIDAAYGYRNFERFRK